MLCAFVSQFHVQLPLVDSSYHATFELNETCAYTAFFWLLDACSLSESAGICYHGCLVITTQLTDVCL